jgi:hypothetical protein
MTLLLRCLVVLVIGCHGVAYVVCSVQDQLVLRGWTGRSWVLGAAVSGDGLRALAVGLWAVAGIGLICVAAAIGLSSLALGFWRPIAVGSTLASIASFLVIWDGRAGGFAPEGGIGMVISAMILAVAIGL